MVIAEATSLMSGMRARMRRGWWWKAAMAASVPWPSASGRPAEDDEPGDEAAAGHDERDQPWPRRVGDGQPALADRRRGQVAGQAAEEQPRGQVEGGREDDRADAADDADQGSQHHPLAQVRRVAQRVAQRKEPWQRAPALSGHAVPLPGHRRAPGGRRPDRSAGDAARLASALAMRSRRAATTARCAALPRSLKMEERRPAVVLVALGRDEAASLEAANKTAGARDRDAQPIGQVAHVLAVALGQDHQCAPLREGQVAPLARLAEG